MINEKEIPKISEARKKLLSSYADAAACLYGVLSVEEFVGVFNYYEEEKTDKNEAFWALLQYEEENEFTVEYNIYENFVVGPTIHPGDFEDDLDELHDIRQQQNGKPRYLPSRKEAFLKFSDSCIIDPEKPYTDLKLYIIKNKLIDPLENKRIDDNLLTLHELIQDRVEPAGLLQYFINMDYKLQVKNMDIMNEFLHMLMEVYNNTRSFENNGFTPDELRKVYEIERSEEIVIHRPKKVGRNEPCPCGSGKKFKKCCDFVDMNEAAQITPEERKFFYETWYKLLDYVNRKLKVVNYEFSLTYLDIRDESQLMKIRDEMWKNPHLISEFINVVDNLTASEIELLSAWEKHHVKGKFMLIKHTAIDSILMCLEDDSLAKMYAVKGLTNSIAGMVRRKLPIMLETTLLPFKDVIVYDSFMALNQIEFDSTTAKLAEQQYVEAEKEHRIIIKF